MPSIDKSLARGLSRREVRRISASLEDLQQAVAPIIGNATERLTSGRRLSQGEPRSIAERCARCFEDYAQTVNGIVQVGPGGNRAQLAIVVVVPERLDMSTRQETVLSLQSMQFYVDRRRIVTGECAVMIELAEHALRRFFQRGGIAVGAALGKSLANSFWSLVVSAMMQRWALTRKANELSVAVPFAEGILLGNACIVRAAPDALSTYRQYGRPGGTGDFRQPVHPMQLPGDVAVLFEYRTWISADQLSSRQSNMIQAFASVVERFETRIGVVAEIGFLGRRRAIDEQDLIEAQRQAGEQMADLLLSDSWREAFMPRSALHKQVY